jgi:AAA domain
MDRPFVIVTGLPGSGKTRVARELGPALGLDVIDKDDILERLFDARGIGDAAWRRGLSREADAMMEADARASPGAVLVSFWRLPGMPATTGTPTAWLPTLSEGLVTLECVSDADIAAERFVRRRRHPGHLDETTAPEAVASRFRDQLAMGRVSYGACLSIDTSSTVDVSAVAAAVREALARR